MNYIKELTKYQENNFENIFNLANKKSFYFFVFFSNIFLIIAILIEYGSNGLNNVLKLYLVYFGTNFLIFLIFLVKFIEKDFHFYYLMVLLQNLFHITLSFLDYDNLNRTFVSNSITNFLLMFIYIIELRHSSRINKVIVIIANSCIFIFLFMIYYLRLKDRSLFQMELIIFIKLVFFLVYKNCSEINIITNLKEIISSQEKEIMHFKSILENFKTPFISINLKNSTIFDNSLYRTIFKYDHLEEEREENIEINNKNPNYQKVLFHNVEKIEILKNFHERLNIKIDIFSILIKHFQIFKRINLVELKMQKENILDSVKIEKGDKLSDIIYFVIENKNFINNLSFLGKFEYESNKNINLNVYIRKYEVSNETIIDLNFDIQTNEDLTQKNLSNKSKLLFFAKIVHEFKTPLFTISTLINNMVFKSEKYGSSNLIMKKKLLEDILNLSNYSISLINDINDFSRNELDYEFECIYDDFNLHETIRFTFSILKTLIICNEIKKTSVIPELEISSNVPVKIRSDEKRLKQVLLNLISNSFKFTNQGKIKIKVDFNNITNEIFFSVEDTGIGIDPIYHKHVFNDYFKVNEIETAQYNTAGSGLGLNICKKIVNQLGNGDLKFESIPNKFTKFWFNIKDMKLKKSLKNVIEIKEKSLSKDYEYSISSSPPLNSKIFKESIKTVEQKIDSYLFHKNSLNVVVTQDEVINNSFSKELKFNDCYQKILNVNSCLEKKIINKENIIILDNLNDSSDDSEKEDDSSLTIKLIYSISTFAFSIPSDYQSFYEKMKCLINMKNINFLGIKPILKYLSLMSEKNERNILLIVDDQKFGKQATKLVIEKYLFDKGKTYSIICANDGFEFIYLLYLDQLMGKNIKYVISDDWMNFIHGSTGYKFLKTIPNLDTTYFKFILLTSYSDIPSIENYEFDKINLLRKPLEKKMVDQIFENNESHDQ